MNNKQGYHLVSHPKGMCCLNTILFMLHPGEPPPPHISCQSKVSPPAHTTVRTPQAQFCYPRISEAPSVRCSVNPASRDPLIIINLPFMHCYTTDILTSLLAEDRTINTLLMYEVYDADKHSHLYHCSQTNE